MPVNPIMVCVFYPNDSARSAFMRGLWKGVAAPLLIYSTYDLPVEIKVMEIPERPVAEPDWVRVGRQLRDAIDQVRGEAAV